jgi:hypothetical protein
MMHDVDESKKIVVFSALSLLFTTWTAHQLEIGTQLEV